MLYITYYTKAKDRDNAIEVICKHIDNRTEYKGKIAPISSEKDMFRVELHIRRWDEVVSITKALEKTCKRNGIEKLVALEVKFNM